MIELVTIIKFENPEIDTVKPIIKSEKLTKVRKNHDHGTFSFFNPAARIVSKQYQKNPGRNSRMLDSRVSSQPCYTHTVKLLGKCYVMCDKKIVRRC